MKTRDGRCEQDVKTETEKANPDQVGVSKWRCVLREKQVRYRSAEKGDYKSYDHVSVASNGMKLHLKKVKTSVVHPKRASVDAHALLRAA